MREYFLPCVFGGSIQIKRTQGDSFRTSVMFLLVFHETRPSLISVRGEEWCVHIRIALFTKVICIVSLPLVGTTMLVSSVGERAK